MFRFKRFAVEQGGAAMKVGTDGVLLGAWCRVEPWQRRMADVGCGTGLIALMMAQRSEVWLSSIGAIEIDDDAVACALANVRRSPWSDRIEVIGCSLQGFWRDNPDKKYDHIVSNPPYFNRSLLPPDSARSAARHTITLSYTELCEGVARLLHGDGIFSVILPSGSFSEFARAASAEGLHLSRATEVYPNDRSAVAKRVLGEFSFIKQDTVRTSLTIEQGGRHCYSEEYVALTRDFYLDR